MGLAATPVASGYAVPTKGLAIRKFVCWDFDAYRRNNIFTILPATWIAADLVDLTGTSLSATTYPVGDSAANKTVVSLYSGRTDGKLMEWFKLSQGGATSDAYNLKEDWWVPADLFSFATHEGDEVRGYNACPRGIPASLWRRMLARFAR